MDRLHLVSQCVAVSWCYELFHLVQTFRIVFHQQCLGGAFGCVIKYVRNVEALGRQIGLLCGIQEIIEYVCCGALCTNSNRSIPTGGTYITANSTVLVSIEIEIMIGTWYWVHFKHSNCHIAHACDVP